MRLVTVDETWIHYYVPETKEQQWCFPSESAPKEAGKVMAANFWDFKGVGNPHRLSAEGKDNRRAILQRFVDTI